MNVYIETKGTLHVLVYWTEIGVIHALWQAAEDGVICVEPTSTRRYRVLVVGAPETGKTSLTRQFTTSEYICSYDSSMGKWRWWPL